MNTRLLINGSDADQYDDVVFSLNYQIADIREPEKRQPSYSKTINIPGTKTNNKLFGFINKIETSINSTGNTNYTPGFNPNLKTDAVVLQDGIEVFRGIIQVVKINKTPHSEKVDYECVLYGKLADIYSALGTSELTDIDWSGYDHTYTKANQIARWSATSDYTYPLIDYGLTNGTTYDVRHFFPAVFLKTYIDKMFEYAGFQYQSNFFSGNFFNKLIIPFNSDKLKLTDSQIALREFRSSRETTVKEYQPTASGGWAGHDTIEFNDDTTSPNSDVSGVYDTSTFTYTVNNTGYYNVSTQLDLSLRLQPNSAATSSQVVSVLVYIQRVSGGVTYPALASFSTNIAAPAGTINPGDIGTTYRYNLNTGSYLFTANDTVKIKIAYYHTSSYGAGGSFYAAGVGGSVYLRVNTGSFFKSQVVNQGIVEGDSLVFSQAIPEKIKMADMLTSVIKMFNLYVEQDKDVQNKLIIEPRNDFYSSGTTRDWSAKLDTSKELQIMPMGALDSRTFRYTYSDDKDYYNEKYNKKFNRTYGDRIEDVTNDFVKDKKENKIIFASTPLVQYPLNQDRVIPQIVQVDQNGNLSPKPGLLRLLYYSGAESTSYSWTYTSTSGNSTETTFPYAGHLDDVVSPTYDLNFGVPKEVYYDAIGLGANYTNNNLYNVYHKQFLDEITDKDSKIVTGYFYLKPTDILKLDFRDTFYFDRNHFRLNKIVDYNPSNRGVTKCEFLKIKNAPPFSPTGKPVRGGTGTTLGSEEVPFVWSPLNDSETAGTSSQRVSGSNNTVDPSARMITIIGDGNTIGKDADGIMLSCSSGNTIYGGATNISLLNSSGNTVYGDSKNITMFNSYGNTIDAAVDRVVLNNCSNMTITEPGVYINSRKVSPEGTLLHKNISLTSADILKLYSTPLTAIEAPGAGFAINVIAATFQYTFGTVVYDTSTDVYLISENANLYMIRSQILKATGSAIWSGVFNNPTVATDTQVIENDALKVLSYADPMKGDGTLSIHITYQLIEII